MFMRQNWKHADCGVEQEGVRPMSKPQGQHFSMSKEGTKPAHSFQKARNARKRANRGKTDL